MICIPIRKKSLGAVLSNLKKAEKLVNLTEIWFDEIKNPGKDGIDKIFRSKKKAIIYKYTGKKEVLDIVLIYKPEYIDLDIATDKKTIKKIKELSPKTKIIVSYHDFKKTPPSKDLKKIIKKMYVLGADIVKIATHAKEFTDSIRMLSLLGELTKEERKAIIICMGKNGHITRAAGHLLGNYLMYAPINGRDKTAHGQIVAKELIKIHSLCH